MIIAVYDYQGCVGWQHHAGNWAGAGGRYGIVEGRGGTISVASTVDCRTMITVDTRVERRLQAGAFGFVSKPFVVDDLLDAIARGMRSSQLSAA